MDATIKYGLAALALVCGLAAWTPQSQAADFKVTVVDARIIPTKADRRCWDVCMAWDHGGLFQLTRKLQGHKGKRAWQRVINTLGAVTLLTGPKMPDPFARLKFSNGQEIKTPAAANTLHPRWNTSGQVALYPGDALSVEVWDKDLRHHDNIGTYPIKKIPARILQKGGIWKLRFQQVYALKLKFTKVASPSGGLFVPGLYEITISHASIHHMRKDGKAWDLFQGKPDPFVTLSFNKRTISTPVEKNTLKPSWKYTERVYLNGNERFKMSIWDKDISRHDLIGTCTYKTIAQLPLDAKGRYRSQCHLAKEITIQLKKIR